MLRSRLAIKITLLIVVVLIAGFGASTIWTIQRESELLVEQSKMAARRLTAAIVASIEGAMLQERPDVTRSVVQELKGSSPVEGLVIYRRNGVEAFSDLATLDEAQALGVIDEGVRARMKEILGRIQTGEYAKEFVLENRAGAPELLSRRRMTAELPIEKVGARLREMMPWIRKNRLVDTSKN